MQLVVKRSDSLVKEVHYSRGPLYVGSQVGCQVCLVDESILPEYAVICGADDGGWFIEDLRTSNRTLVNNIVVRKAHLNDGDIVKIGPFTIEVFFGKGKGKGAAVMGGVEAKGGAHTPKTIIRRYGASDSPDIRMPAGREKDYAMATEAIHRADSAEVMMKTLLSIARKQFGMLHTWISLRKGTSGPMECEVGKRRTGQDVRFDELIFSELILEALNRHEYRLVPILAKDKRYARIRSAVIAPVMSLNGCHGVIYVDNSVEDNHYSLVDVDYLMLVSIHAGVRLKDL